MEGHSTRAEMSKGFVRHAEEGQAATVASINSAIAAVDEARGWIVHAMKRDDLGTSLDACRKLLTQVLGGLRKPNVAELVSARIDREKAGERAVKKVTESVDADIVTG